MLVLGIAGSAAKSQRTRALVALALEGAGQLSGVETNLVDLAETTIDERPDQQPLIVQTIR